MLGSDNVHGDEQPTMGSEDFAFYQEVLPGYFFTLGLKKDTDENVASLHSPFFTLNEDALPYGAALHASLATSYLLKYQQDGPVVKGKYHDEL